MNVKSQLVLSRNPIYTKSLVESIQTICIDSQLHHENRRKYHKEFPSHDAGDPNKDDSGQSKSSDRQTVYVNIYLVIMLAYFTTFKAFYDIIIYYKLIVSDQKMGKNKSKIMRGWMLGREGRTNLASLERASWSEWEYMENS